MNEKVKVLYFVDRMLRGGIQTFVLENIKYMDRQRVQIDFLLLDDGNEYELENTLKKIGCNIYKLRGMWIRRITDFVKYNKVLDKFFKEHNDYKVVHMHSSSKNYMVLKKAKKYGIPVRIAHSHNIGFQSKSKIRIALGNLLKPFLKYYATDYFACSEIAGKWLFGKKITSSNKFKVIHNAVDLEKFKFDECIRKKIRKDFNIDEDTLVIGHVGRFTNQKNHEFLIDIFNEINKRNSDSKLLMIGTGEKEKIIKEKIKTLNLENSVIFAGFKNNVNEYMYAMDIFVFPSLYEGLGLVLIEAQATGMKCFTSKDVVPVESKVSDLLEFIRLEETPTYWAEQILKSDKIRKNVYEQMKLNGYDISNTALFLENFYIKGN